MDGDNTRYTGFTASLHTHVRSINDAHIEAGALVERIKEMGGQGCAITDHGALSSIEDYRRAFKAAGLKLVPGCELYVDGGVLGRLHLVVLAKNDNGYKGISKMVTEANRNLDGGFPVISQGKLLSMARAYKGDIIALSACAQGVLCAIFLRNGKIDEKEQALRKKQEGYMAPDSANARGAREDAEAAARAHEAARIERDDLKRLAEMKFAGREKAVEKLEKREKDGKAAPGEARMARMELEKDKEASAAARARLGAAQEAADAAKKALSAANKKLRETEASVGKYLAYEEKIQALEAGKGTEEELFADAEATAREYADAFGDGCFYVEVQYHGIPDEAACYPKAAILAKRMGLPLVATNDVHILTNSEDERLKRQILRSMRFGVSFEEEQAGDAELYLKDDAQLASALGKILPEDAVEEAMGNISKVFGACSVEFKTGTHYPRFSKDGDPDAMLDAEVEKGIAWRFPNGMDEAHKERLAHELPIIKSMGYSDYHLIVKDFLEYGRLLGSVPSDMVDAAPLSVDGLKAWIEENGFKAPGFVVGPGRGSAVGSLTCYLLGITALDPMKYGLLFERFLNPERASMPDIDSDLSATTRGKVIEYVKAKYGADAVCAIMTMTMQGPKGAVQIAAKYYGLRKDGNSRLAYGREIAKDIPADVGTSFSTRVSVTNGVASCDPEGAQTLIGHLEAKYAADPWDKKEAAEEKAEKREIVHWAKLLEGAFTAYGAHAAGIVISDNGDVSDYIPLRMNDKIGMFTTQCDMVQVEENGLLKFDLLGLTTLDIITDTLRMVEQRTGEAIDPLEIPLDDERVYKEVFSAGKTVSVFQFESDGMKNTLKRFKPERFEDLIILCSMFRPGPQQYLDSVIAVKNGKKKMEFLVPQLMPILGKTYGAIVYQEQVMQISQALAGFTLGHADELRRYMSKKKADKLAHERPAFIEGCRKNGVPEAAANALFDQMMDFARYAFNKSHAAAYSYNAYITAYLKLHYPVEFFAAALNWADKKPVKRMEAVSALMYDAMSWGVEVLAPDINESGKMFTVAGGKIRFGLSSVASVKSNADAIIKERGAHGPYASMKDFFERLLPGEKVVMNLVDAGAFDSFGKNRAALKQMAAELKAIVPKWAAKASFIKSAEAVLPIVERATAEEIVKAQEEQGLAVAIKEPTTAEKLGKRIETAKAAMSALEKEVGLVKLHLGMAEDKAARMKEEKKLLGAYVTEHPMDFYPRPAKVGAVPVMDIARGTRTCYGVITKLTLKKRKRDGADMAFFSIEDRSGEIECAVFAASYEKCKAHLSDDNVVKLYGHCEEEDVVTSEGLVTGVKKTFIVQSMEPVVAEKLSVMMDVTSYAVYHLVAEEAFIKAYGAEDGEGRKLLIFDRAMDEVREASYRVTERALALPNVREVSV